MASPPTTLDAKYEASGFPTRVEKARREFVAATCRARPVPCRRRLLLGTLTAMQSRELSSHAM